MNSFMSNNGATSEEIHFVKTLGTHRNGAPERVEEVPRATRFSLLVNYRRAMDKRADWGAIDPLAVQEVTDQLIAELSS
jgi:hypothetical protein